MKNLILSMAAVFCFCLMLTSCGKDVCYDCPEYEDSVSGITIPAIELCSNDSISKSDVEEAIDEYEKLANITCTKQ